MPSRIVLFGGAPSFADGDSEFGSATGPSLKLLLLAAMADVHPLPLGRIDAARLLYGDDAQGSRRLSNTLADLRRRDAVQIEGEKQLRLMTPVVFDLALAREASKAGQHAEVVRLLTHRCFPRWDTRLSQRAERFLDRLDDDADGLLRQSLAAHLLALVSAGQDSEARQLLNAQHFYEPDSPEFVAIHTRVERAVSERPVPMEVQSPPGQRLRLPTVRRYLSVPRPLLGAVLGAAVLVAAWRSWPGPVPATAHISLVGDVLSEHGTITPILFDGASRRMTLGTSRPTPSDEQWFATAHRFAAPVADPATGGWIAAIGAHGGLDLRLIRAEGAVDTLAAGPGDDFHPAPSPDGRLLAFATSRWSPRGEYRVGVAVLDRETGVVRPVLFDLSRTTQNPVWSNDGGALAFTQFAPDTGQATSLCVAPRDVRTVRCHVLPFSSVAAIIWDGDSTIAVRAGPPGSETLMMVDAGTFAVRPYLRMGAKMGGCQGSIVVRGVLCSRQDSLFFAPLGEAAPRWESVGRVPGFRGWDGSALRIASPATVIPGTTPAPVRVLTQWSPFGLPAPVLGAGSSSPTIQLNGDESFFTEVVSVDQWSAERRLDVWLEARIPVMATKWQSLQVVLVAARATDSVAMNLGVTSDVEPLTLLRGASQLCALELPRRTEPLDPTAVTLTDDQRETTKPIASLRNHRWVPVYLSWRPGVECRAQLEGQVLSLDRKRTRGTLRLILAGQSVGTKIEVRNVRVVSAPALP